MAKAQVLAGRRGKEHAVIPCDDEKQLADAVRSLLGRKLSDETVEKVLVEQKLDVAQEVYAAVTYVQASPAVILSASGGVDVEKACHESQEGVLVEPVNILRGLDARAGGRSGAPRRPRRRRGRRSPEALPHVHRLRRHVGRDQSAGANPRRPMDRRRRQGRDRRRRDVPPNESEPARKAQFRPGADASGATRVGERSDRHARLGGPDVLRTRRRHHRAGLRRRHERRGPRRPVPAWAESPPSSPSTAAIPRPRRSRA